MAEALPPVNPLSTGHGGSRFELWVAAYYVVALLKEEFPRGLENVGAVKG